VAKLDSLVVDMQLNSAALRSGLDAAKGALSSFGASIADIDKKLTSLSQAKSFEIGKEAIKGLGEFVLHGAEAADQMGKLAQAAGQSVEAFSRIAYGANLSGVSTEELGKAFVHLNKNLAEAGSGSAKHIALFSALGVAVKDSSGHVRDSGAVLADLANKFAQYQDGASKGAIASELFGQKIGASLIPLLNGGGEGLAKLGAEADRFGITISTSAAKGAEEFNDNLQRLEIASQRVGTRVAGELAPALAELTSQLLNSKEGADALRGASDVLANVLKVLVSGGILITAVFEAVGTTLGRVASAVVSAAKGEFAAAGSDLKSFVLMDDIIAAGKSGADRIGAVWTSSSAAVEAHGNVVKKSMDGIAKAILTAPKSIAEYQSAMKALTKVAEEYESKVSGFGAGPLGELEARLTKGDLADELKKIGKEADGMRERILGAAAALQELKLEKLESANRAQVDRVAAATGQQVIQRTTEFQNVGKSIGQDDRTKGFASFDAAMKEFEKQTVQSAKEIGRAAVFRENGDEAAAEGALQLGEQAKLAADNASQAADAFKAGAEALQSSLEGAGKSIASQMGEVGKVINSGVDGFKSGGLQGAVIAIIAQILTMLEGFDRMVSSMNNVFGKGIAKIGKALEPFFTMLINLGESGAAIIDAIESVVNVFGILRGVFWVLGKVVDGVTLFILYIAKAIADIFGGNEGLNNQIAKIEKDIAKPFDEAADSAEKVSDAFNELVTNIPTGYKLRAAQFAADNGTGSSRSGTPGAYVDPASYTTSDPTQTEHHGGAGYYSAGQDQTSESTRPSSTEQGLSAESTRPGSDWVYDPNAEASGNQQQGSGDESGQSNQAPTVVIQNVNVTAKSFSDFVQQITEAQQKGLTRSRRNGTNFT
jgi:hypothetical protein